MTGSIRLQVNGEKHLIADFVQVNEKEFWWKTVCGIRVIYGTVGTMPFDPEYKHSDCINCKNWSDYAKRQHSG